MVTTQRILGKTGRMVRFIHRDFMANPFPLRQLGGRAASITIPATSLPVDSDNGGQMPLGPTEGNVSEPGEIGYGDCGEAMVARADNVLTYGQGHSGFTESTFTTSSLTSQYLKVSGGDNGLDEDEVTTGIWSVGIGGNSQAIAVSYMDFDCTNAPLTQYLTDQFYLWCLGWSVPDKFIQEWEPGSVWMDAMAPDDNNGHFTVMASVLTGTMSGQSVQGATRQYTWDAFSYAGPDFIASVNPQAFVAFSPRQFNLATGLDSKGRHITTQAAAWAAIGGAPIPLMIINAFPPLSTPTPTPVVVAPTPVTPTPIPVTPTPVLPPVSTVPSTALWIDKPSKTLHVPPGWTTATHNLNPEIIVHPNKQIIDYPNQENWKSV
jgi:hypothetical protein